MNYNKVIFICNYAANYAGNFLASLDSLAKQLKKKQKKVIFVFPNEAKNKDWEIDLSEFQLIYSDFNDKEALLKSIKNEILDSNKVIIHTHFMKPIFLLKLKKILSNDDKVIFHQHMAVNRRVKDRIKQVLEGVALRLFGFDNTVYIGVSPDVYSNICREFGKSKAKLVINSIDLKRLQSPKAKLANNNILIFGTFYKEKGVDLAIKAIEKAHLESKVNLIVVTHTPEATKNIIKDEFNTVPNFVNVIAPSNNVQELYKNSFLFLSPSRFEAFGYSVVESAYSGLRVIASNVPGQNMLKNIPSIVWVKSENVEQLSDAILKEYRISEIGPSDMAKTRKIIEKKYSLNRWVKQIIKIYDED